ncbi:hypothetical protein Tco_1319445 [Tanacetum coccineum]
MPAMFKKSSSASQVFIKTRAKAVGCQDKKIPCSASSSSSCKNLSKQLAKLCFLRWCPVSPKLSSHSWQFIRDNFPAITASTSGSGNSLAKHRIGSEAITYNLDQTSRYSANYTHMTANKIDVIDMACEEYSQEVLGFTDIIASGNHPVL